MWLIAFIHLFFPLGLAMSLGALLVLILSRVIDRKWHGKGKYLRYILLLCIILFGVFIIYDPSFIPDLVYELIYFWVPIDF